MKKHTPEQKARDLLERIGVYDAQSYSSGELVEIANLIEHAERLERALDHISTADCGGELFHVGPYNTVYSEDGNTVIKHEGPWHFLSGKGDTFLEAVEDNMRKCGV